MRYKIMTPVVTIFNEDYSIDYESNKKVIDFLIDGGVDGILVLGSTGEFTGLSYEQKKEFFKFYADYVDKRVEIYAGTGSMNFNEVVKLSDEVTDMGFDGVYVIGPYYYGTDQEKLYIYYNELAKKTKANVYIYNFPDRTGHSLDPETIAKLCEDNHNIKGLKDSVTAPLHTNLTLRSVKSKDFEAYSGFDDQFIFNIAAGGYGCISALSNLVPEIWSDLVESANNRDFDKVMTYHMLINRLMPLYTMDSNFSYLFKILMVKRGLEIDPRAEFPYNQIKAEIVEEAWDILKSVIKDYSVLKNN